MFNFCDVLRLANKFQKHFTRVFCGTRVHNRFTNSTITSTKLITT